MTLDGAKIMAEKPARKNTKSEASKSPKEKRQAKGTNNPEPIVLACVDRSRHGRRVLAHAGALARAMGGQLILMRVLAPHSGNDLPPDPVDWEMRRREDGCALVRLAECGGVEAEIVLAQGRGPFAVSTQSKTGSRLRSALGA